MKLSSLGLNRTQVTDAGLAHLKGLTKLSSLGLDGTLVTDAGLVQLGGTDQTLSPRAQRHSRDRRGAGAFG